MASILRKGGNSPIQVKGWQDSVRLNQLQKIYDRNGNALIADIWHYFDEEIEFVFKRWRHRLNGEEVRAILGEMISDGWVEVSEWKCVCCATQKHDPKEILKHAVRLKLTSSGYDKVPESIFP